MRNKVHKLKKINNKIIIISLFIVLLAIVFFILFKQKSNNNINMQIAETKLSNYSIEVGNNNTIINFDKAIAKTREEVNAPKLGAGMIPIIDLGNGNYKITTADDINWYDYTKNKPAYIMLSDGYYKSELEQGIKDEQLMANAVGVSIPDNPDILGSIYIWIPRFAYCEDNIGFLKETGIINASNWVTPEMFTLKWENSKYNIELTGIWIEKTVQTSESATNTKISQMNTIDNQYGLIANEKVFKLDEDVKLELQQYNNQYKLDTCIDDYTNNNRTCIKIIDTNAKTELVAKADMVGKKVKITIQQNDYDIEKVVNITSGQVLDGLEYPVEKLGGFYPFIVVDAKGNMITVTAGFEENPPDLTGVRIDSTYIVTYSGEIGKGTAEEISRQPISEILDEGYIVDDNNALITGDIDFSKVDETRGKWYDYANQKWANIVTRNNGNEAYFVWIPRYAYALNTQEQTSDIVFIDTDNISPRTGKEVDLNKYTIPEAFTWEKTNDDGTTETVQLPGYWIGKYQLSSYVTFNLSAQTYSGVRKIRVLNITNNVVSASNARYDITLKKDGQEIKTVTNANASMYEFSEETGTRLEGGEYEILIKLYDEQNCYIGEKTITEVAYGEPKDGVEPNPPDLTGFRVDTTYIVTYNEDGSEDNTQSIESVLKAGAVINEETKTLESGEVDISKIRGTWYNYSEQKWANIVAINGGNEAYYIWIPRYEYHAYADTETTDVYFIPTTQEMPTYGHTIPEAFTWEKTNEDGTTETVQLSGYWIGKYQLSSHVDLSLSAQTYSGIRKIRVLNITNNIISTSNARYDITLKKDGEEIKTVTNANASLYEFSEETGTKLEGGEYEIIIKLYDEYDRYVGENTFVGVAYGEPNPDTEPNPPDLTGFDESSTFYVVYNDDGTEDSSVPISTKPAPEGWYDYANQKWANIVVKNNDKVAYFVWIPRYEYHAYADTETTDVYFIPTTQETPTYGYTIPEAFTWEKTNEDGTTETVQIPGYWIGKYQLSN